MTRLIDRVPDHTRPALQQMDERLRVALSKINKINVRDIETIAAGGVRLGTEATRGSAADRFPEVFIQWEPTEVKVFVTIPTTASGGWNWAQLMQYDF